jgi:hypothetical protein
MNSLLRRIRLKQAVGLYVGDAEVAASHVVLTAGGLVELSRQCVAATAEDMPRVLTEVLASVPGGRHRPRVAVGVPARRVFFATRNHAGSGNPLTADTFLQEVLQSPSLSPDDMVADLQTMKMDGRTVGSVAACRRRYVSNLLATLQEQRVAVHRVEPAHCALLRVGEYHRRSPRRAKTVLRIFLGCAEGIAVLSHAGQPIACRPFQLPAGGEPFAILATVRALQLGHRARHPDSTIHLLLVHGRSDLTMLAERLQQTLEMPVHWCDAPAFDAGSLAFGLALGVARGDATSFDIARTLKPPSSLRELVPWGDLAVQMALWVCLWLYLSAKSDSLDHALRTVRSDNQRRTWLTKVADPQLTKERLDLEQKTAAVHKFVGDRVIWTRYLDDLSRSLPEKVTVTTFEGQAGMASGGLKNGTAGSKQKGEAVARTLTKKKFLLRGVAEMSDSATPVEIDALAASLPNNPVFKGDFPGLTLQDLKKTQDVQTKQQQMSFLLTYAPAKARRPEPDKEKEK